MLLVKGGTTGTDAVGERWDHWHWWKVACTIGIGGRWHVPLALVKGGTIGIGERCHHWH